MVNSCSSYYYLFASSADIKRMCNAVVVDLLMRYISLERRPTTHIISPFPSIKTVLAFTNGVYFKGWLDSR